MVKSYPIHVQKNNTTIMYKVPLKCLSQKQKTHKDLINYEKITLKIKTNLDNENINTSDNNSHIVYNSLSTAISSSISEYIQVGCIIM